MIVWKIEKRKIKDLKPYPKNPRKLSKHDADNLKRNLKKFGLIDKPIITQDGLIIGGHQRISVLKKMGHKEVDCEVPDQALSDKDIEELNIGMNRIHGEFDYDILANQFEVEDLLNYGFTEEELSISPIQDVSGIEEEKSKKEKTCPHCGQSL